MPQRLIHRLDDQGLPPPDLELRLAADFLGNPNPLGRRVLRDLVAYPKRFGELRPLLAGRSDNNLTLVLKRLKAEGLIDQRVDPRTPRDAFVYGLTSLGVDVFVTLKHLEFTHAAQRVAAQTMKSTGGRGTRA